MACIPTNAASESEAEVTVKGGISFRTTCQMSEGLSRCGHLHPEFIFIMTGMSGGSSEFEDVVDELRSQGLIVTIHSAPNETWYVKGEGIYTGYVVTGDELIALKRENRLDLRGVKSLG